MKQQTNDFYVEEAQKLIYSVFNIIQQDFEEEGGIDNIEIIFTDLYPEPFTAESIKSEFVLTVTLLQQMPEYLVIIMQDGTWYYVYKNIAANSNGPKYNLRLFGTEFDDDYLIGNLGKQHYNLKVEN